MLPYAEEINYWKTSRSSPDQWIAKTCRLIESFGGTVTAEAFGRDNTGRAAFMIRFDCGEESFKIVWPVLPTKSCDDRAARVQAATLLYHDAKAKAISASVLGVRAAFFQHLMIDEARTASEVSDLELLEHCPKLLTAK